MQVPESGDQQAKLLLELQKENRELRMELAKQKQQVLAIQAQALAAASASPATASSLLTPAPSSAKRSEKSKPRPSFNCFSPESRKKTGNDTAIKDLARTIKAHDAEIERLKKDHTMQMKLKNDFIHELSRKVIELGGGVNGVLTRARCRPSEPPQKRYISQILSPAPTAKKRRFWDITTANSPSIDRLTGRKTRTQLATGPAAAAKSLLPQVL